MTNREIAELFNRIADILQMKEENIFKIRAYRKAADAIYHLENDIKELYKKESLNKIPGVGKDIKDKITELLETGRCLYYEKLLEEFPPDVLEFLNIPGIGHKSVKIIYDKLAVSNMDELLEAAEARQIRALPGLGAKTEYNIKKGIDMLRKRQGKVVLGIALPLAEDFSNYLLSFYRVLKAEPVGSLRRGKALVSDIDILVATEYNESVCQWIKKYRHLQKITEVEEDRVAGVLIYGVEFEVILVHPDDYYHSLLWTTGSKEHRGRLFAKLDRNSLKEMKSEKEIYEIMNMDYIPPELRENKGEFEAAYSYKLPLLIRDQDIRGDLHLHSNWSDGANKIEEMAKAARALNYEYIAITDHSKSLPISGGLNEERLLSQGREIDNLNIDMHDFTIFKGIEVDILKDGSLDFEDEILEKLDIVVASVHSHFGLDRERQTERIIRAINNKYVNIIGHLTGRLLNRRNAYDLDIDEILTAVAENKVILEMNSHPDRLDIDEDVARKARDYGIKIAINSDAHSRADLKLLRYGVLNARRGWLESSDVVNTWSRKELLEYIKE